MRRLAVLAAALAVVTPAAGAAASGTAIRATLLNAIPSGKVGGEHVRVTWRLRNASGRTVRLARVTLTITCPTGTDSTNVTARPRRDGTYSVLAVVPPGGIGTLSIATSRRTFPLTNPYHR